MHTTLTPQAIQTPEGLREPPQLQDISILEAQFANPVDQLAMAAANIIKDRPFRGVQTLEIAQAIESYDYDFNIPVESIAYESTAFWRLTQLAIGNVASEDGTFSGILSSLKLPEYRSSSTVFDDGAEKSNWADLAISNMALDSLRTAAAMRKHLKPGGVGIYTLLASEGSRDLVPHAQLCGLKVMQLSLNETEGWVQVTARKQN